MRLTSARSPTLIAEYFTTVGAEDSRNSRGNPVADWCAIVRQDRANHHRFGIRHDGDRGDPIFADGAARAAISGRCRVAPGSEHIPGLLEQGKTRHLWVRVYGDGATPSVVLVSEGAG